MRKRVAIGMIFHETNTFSPVPTPLEAWQAYQVMVEGEILQHYPDTRTDLGAFLEVAQREDWDVIPTVRAVTMPSAPTDADTYAWIKERLLAPIEREQPDAVLLCLHGAMMAAGVDDAEGDLVQAVRALIGDRPLLLTLDLHGNITPAMSAACDAVFAYDTNPHIDQYERAKEAAECLVRVFAGEVKPVTGYAHPPMMPPTINMRTAEGPMAELLELAHTWEAKPDIVSVSIFGGFPYCDFPHAGFSVVTTANGDATLARSCSEAIAARAWDLRESFLKRLPPPEEAVAEALRLTRNGGPIILADVADNPGGGGSGDTTELLREFLRQGAPGAAAAAIWDPETVAKAIETGVGNATSFTIGGKAAPGYGAPLEVQGTVRLLSDGRFYARGAFEGHTNMGPSAVIEVDGIRLVVTTRRVPCNSADLFRSVGIVPEEAPILLVKSRGHFRASFEPFARAIIEVDAPGAANPGLDRYHYQRLPRPIWPLDR